MPNDERADKEATDRIVKAATDPLTRLMWIFFTISCLCGISFIAILAHHFWTHR